MTVAVLCAVAESSLICVSPSGLLGRWAAGAPCAELSSHYKMLLSFGPFLSEEKTGKLSLPMPAIELPAVGDEYTLVLSGPSNDLLASSARFAITCPAIILEFHVIQNDPGVTTKYVQALVPLYTCCLRIG